MNFLELNTIRRKRLDRSALIYGIIAGVVLIGGLIQFYKLGKVPLLEELARQLGLLESLPTLELIALIIAGIVLLRGLAALFRTKKEFSGAIKIDPGKMHIQKGKHSFELTGNSLQEMTFELKAPRPEQPPLTGGNWVKIPSPAGTYRCEFDLCDQPSFNALKDYIKHYETVHNVTIAVKEAKS